MPGGFMTCTAMFFSGVRTGMEIIPKKRQLIRKGQKMANSVFCVEARGS